MYLLFIRNKMRSHRACFTMRQRTSTKQTEIIYSAYGSALMSSAPQMPRDSTSIRYPPQQHQHHKYCTDTRIFCGDLERAQKANPP